MLNVHGPNCSIGLSQGPDMAAANSSRVRQTPGRETKLSVEFNSGTRLHILSTSGTPFGDSVKRRIEGVHSLIPASFMSGADTS